MAFYEVEGNALDFNILVACISTSAGSRGQNKVKENLLTRILSKWPELDGERDDVQRIDDAYPEAKSIRRMLEIDGEEQGVLAETFLDAVKPTTTTTARFRMFCRAAKMVKISDWWGHQTTEKLAPFKGQADGAIPLADKVS